MPDIDIRRLDFDFVADLEFWLKTHRNCDGDSVALHITYRLTYFCTNDLGKSAKPNATLGLLFARL